MTATQFASGVAVMEIVNMTYGKSSNNATKYKGHFSDGYI